MPAIDLSILNQRQTPAFYADTLANRPAAGFVGRIFVSTDTFAFYRDNGTTWDLIGGPGTGTVTGTGANGQVTYWNGASTITGSNDLFFDAVNGHLGIGTVTPGTALDVKHDQSTVVQLEQVTATNDIRIAFINNGVGLWRLGAFYNAGANDFGLFDIAAAAQPVTVKRTTGQVLIGTSTVGSGKLVVASSTGDNGVQIVGASAPSLRIDNAESGPTKRAGFGISTATNNFIQGSADRDFCMFNGSTTASPILFGIYGTTNVLEAARISAARNFLVGKTTDSGQNFQVQGTSNFNGTTTFGAGSATAIDGADGRIITDKIRLYNAIPATNYSDFVSAATQNRTITIPDATGTIALTSDLSSYLPLTGGTLSGALTMNAYSFSAAGLQFTRAASNTANPGGGNGMMIFAGGNAQMRMDTNNFINFDMNNGGNPYTPLRIAQSGVTVQVNSPDNVYSLSLGYQGVYAGFFGGFSNAIYALSGNGGNVLLNASSVWVAVSDGKRKRNLENYNLGLSSILGLQPKLYNMDFQKDGDEKQVGLIAQSVKEYIPLAYEQNDEFIGLNYNAIIVTMINAIKELNNKIENLKN